MPHTEQSRGKVTQPPQPLSHLLTAAGLPPAASLGLTAEPLFRKDRASSAEPLPPPYTQCWGQYKCPGAQCPASCLNSFSGALVSTNWELSQEPWALTTSRNAQHYRWTFQLYKSLPQEPGGPLLVAPSSGLAWAGGPTEPL